METITAKFVEVKGRQLPTFRTEFSGNELLSHKSKFKLKKVRNTDRLQDGFWVKMAVRTDLRGSIPTIP